MTDEWEYDKMYELLKKSNKTLKNKLKKFLTKTSECDKIKKLCHKKRTTQNLDNWITKQPWTLIQISFGFSWEWCLQESPWNRTKVQNLNITVMTGKEPVVLDLDLTSWTFYLRVWSWLRMNAGGVPNTCKSNEAPYRILRMKVWWLSGGRVSNAWVTCPVQGDNSWKRLLIPHKRTRRHLLVWKTPVVQDGPASD